MLKLWGYVICVHYIDVTDSLAMNNDGFEFFCSVNGVWLTKEVPVKYLRKLEL